MKKKVLIILGIIITLFIAGLIAIYKYSTSVRTTRDPKDSIKEETTKNQITNNIIEEDTNTDTKAETQWKIENVKITVKEDSITKTSAIIVIEDRNENQKSWGMDFAIQKSGDNDKWVDMITKETITWLEIAVEPNKNGITQMQLDWSKIYGELNTGTYRIVKYNGLSTLYSEPFKINNTENITNNTSINQSTESKKENIDIIKIKVNNNVLNVKLEANEATKNLIERLKNGDITVNASEYGGFEKVGNLGFSLPRNDTNITTSAGDIVLYQGNQISLFYNSNSWSYTRLGKVQSISSTELENILGSGNVTLVLSLD